MSSTASSTSSTPHPGASTTKKPRSSLDPQSVFAPTATTSETDLLLMEEESIRFGCGEADDEDDSHKDSPTDAFHTSSIRAKHNTTVALRFLEDQEEQDGGEFDLGGIPHILGAPSNANAILHKSVADFHMSQLRFPTVGGGPATSIFEDESESTLHDLPDSRFYSKRKPETSTPQTNVFSTRQDLREVDQSVNL
jgi:hypothetical protein